MLLKLARVSVKTEGAEKIPEGARMLFVCNHQHDLDPVMLLSAFPVSYTHLYNYNNITKNPEDLGFESVINDKIVNIALFGIDTRDPKSFKGLSDSIMILSLNTETKKVKLM